jgi:hypothetical protein
MFRKPDNKNNKKANKTRRNQRKPEEKLRTENLPTWSLEVCELSPCVGPLFIVLGKI